jgi:membrane protease subunit (stomatin/prohibitin family)
MRGAMVAGVGYTAYKAGQHGEQDRSRESEQEARIQELEAQQYQQQAAPAQQASPAGMTMDQKAEQLTKLKGLLDAGVLTQDEFDQQKMKVLSS